MTSIKKIISLGGLGIFIVIFGSLTYLYQGNYSSGFRPGVVIKLSKKGYVFKTNEGQLDQGIINLGEGNGSNIFMFSVDSDQEEVLRVLEEVALSRERVNLYYKEKFVKLSWRGDTEYFVYKVERLNKQ